MDSTSCTTGMQDYHKHLVDELNVDGRKTWAAQKLTENGLGHTYSPFWQLKWVREHFYQCFGICILHLEYLGLVKVHVSFCLLCLLTLVTSATRPIPNGVAGQYQCRPCQRTSKRISTLPRTNECKEWSSSCKQQQQGTNRAFLDGSA